MTLEDNLKGQEQAGERDELRAALNRTLRELARAKAKTEDLVDATYHAVRDAMTAHPPRPIAAPVRRREGKNSEEAALWHLSDWQGFKRTPSYNADVMRERVNAFIDKAGRISDIQRADHPVRVGLVCFGGDMGEGLFNYPTQPYEIDATIFEQWVGISRLLAETVQRALSIYDDVYVFDEDGNHGRIGSKRDGVPKSDNLDRMAYATARIMVGEQKRLHWPEPSAEDIKRIEYGNYRSLLMHGDETGRNGFTSPATFVNYLNKLKAGGYGWDFQDVYTGHRHTHMEMSLADGTGSWYQTGSTESDNRYARDSLGSAADPSQRLHFIEPDKGLVTAQYKVRLT